MSTSPTQSGSGVIEVIFLDLRGRAARYDQDLSLLSRQEQVRAGRFHFARDRTMFVACRAALRRILGERTGIQPEAIGFDLGACGKPSLARGHLQFNISHSGDWFACALSDAGPVGIDIECARPIDNMADVAKHFFSAAECERLFRIEESERLSSFFECWTRKEAVIKATGEGVSRPLDSFEVAFGPEASASLLRLDEQRNPGWTMESFRPAPGYIAALAAAFPFPIESSPVK